jgi:hypothetical protein
MPEPGRESAKYRGFLGQPLLEAALVALAAAQHGVIGLSQVLELGLSARAVQSRSATGRLHRIHHGVYSLVPRELLTREGLYMAAVLACGPGAVLSHRSGARLHELRNYGYYRIEVTIPRRSTLRHSGVAVHRSTTLTQADVTVVNNIPVTTVHRTLFDIGDLVTQRQLERAFDQAEIAEVLDLHAINDQLRPQPDPQSRQTRPQGPGRALHRPDPHMERERGSAPRDHTIAEAQRP